MTTRVATALLDSGFDEALVRRLARSDAAATVVRRCVDLVELRTAVGAGQVDVAVIDARLVGLDVDALAEMHSRGVRVVLVSADPALVPLMGADAITEPDVNQVLPALRGGASSRAAVPAGDPSVPSGRVVAVWGPVGSPGRTTVSIGLADELSRLGLSTLLVDADTYGPAVAPLLGLLSDSSGLVAASRLAAQGKLDVDALRRVSVSLPSGLAVLTGLARAAGWEELRPVALDATISVARAASQVTVVDVGFCVEHDPLSWFEPGAPARNQAAVAVLGAADIVLAVAGADPVSLVRFVQGFPDVRSLAPTALVETIVNQVPRGRTDRGQILQVLAEQVGSPPGWLFSSDPEAASTAVRDGRTLAEAAPRSALRQELRALAAQLGGVPLPRGRRRAA